MINFQYNRATSIENALDILKKNPGSKFIAGGTNLVDLMKMGVMTPERIIDINRLPLAQIEHKDKALVIGSLALNSDTARHELVKKHQPLLSLALQAGASPQLRNMATVGGNMMQRTRCPYFFDTSYPCNKRNPGSGCSALQGYNRMHAILGTSDQCIAVHPSDMCVALTALNAGVQIKSPNNERNIDFSAFHRLPGNTPEKDNNLEKDELIISVSIPDNTFNKFYYLKLRDRASYAFALVSVAAALEMKNGIIENISLALGGVSHKPWKPVNTCNFLKGKKPELNTLKQAAMLAIEGAKGYGQNNFKLRMTPNAIVEAVMQAVES